MWYVLIGYVEGWEVLDGPFDTKPEAHACMTKRGVINGPVYALAYVEQFYKLEATPHWRETDTPGG